MVKIGEVEFVVKFDPIGKQFKDVIQDVLGDLDFNTEDLDDRLAGIEGYLGLLVTPFSGNRMIDLVKSKGYLEQLRNEEWIKGKVEAMAAHPTLLTKLGLEEMTPGTEETQEAVAEKFEYLRKDIADFIRITFSSEFAYIKNFATLQDIISLLTTSTEGNLAYLMEKIIDKLKAEPKVDKAVFDWLKEDMEVKIGDVQRLWQELIKDVVSDNEQNVVESYQDFIDLLGEKFADDEDRDEIIERILFKGPEALTGEYKKRAQELLEETTFKAGIQLPRGIGKLLEEIKETELLGKGIRNDLKFIVEDVDKVSEIVEKMGAGLTEEERQKLIERATKSIEDWGWYFFFGESKVFGSKRKLEAEKAKVKGGAAAELLTAGYMGTQFSQFAEEVASKVPIADVLTEMEEKLPERLVESLSENFKMIEKMGDYMRTIPRSVLDGIRDQYDEVMKNITRIRNG